MLNKCDRISTFILLLVLIAFSGTVHAETSIDANNTDLWTSVEDAYVFCYPLVLMDATMKKLTNTEYPTNYGAPVNQLYFTNTEITPDSKNVVSPNVDTIYSGAFLELNDTALVFTKPETDRFCLAQLMDAYSNTVYVAGSGGKADDPKAAEIYLIAGRNYQGEIPDGMTYIQVPTEEAWLLIRTVFNGTEDLPNVEAIEAQMSLIPVEDFLNNQTFAPEKGTYNEEYNFTPSDYVANMSPEEFFTVANSLMETNPPATADAQIAQEMQSINVGPGLTFNESILKADGSEQWNSMVNSMVPVLDKKCEEYLIPLGNWKYYGDPVGDWGTAYAYRCLVALVGFGANPTYVAVYPKITTDSDNEQLSGANRYILHIDKGMIPPVVNDGFWSFTVYGSDNFLIPNEIDRYNINDRSNLTYNPDGSLDILLQAKRPDDDLLNNWLPVGEGDFHIYLRMYVPDLETINSYWTAPQILKQED